METTKKCLISIILLLQICPLIRVAEAKTANTAFYMPASPCDALKPQNRADTLGTRLYLGCEVPFEGEDLKTALFIAEKESHFNVDAHNLKTHDHGIFQFHEQKGWPGKKCAYDLICATKTYLQWIKAGRISEWVTWSKPQLSLK